MIQFDITIMNKMRLAIICISLFVIAEVSTSSVHAQDLNEKKSAHFIIYYTDVPSSYISKVSNRAERYYKSITNYLGFVRFDFWTWDNRCKIYIYATSEEYIDATGAVSWSRGAVHIEDKEVASYVQQQGFFDYVLPHELGHIIFREFVGFNLRLPLWLDEAVALLQESDRDLYIARARQIAGTDYFIPLDKLSSVRSYNLVSPEVFYSEAASIIDFLLTKYGREMFVIFCRRMRDGNNWREALCQTYKFRNLEHMEELWLIYLNN